MKCWTTSETTAEEEIIFKLHHSSQRWTSYQFPARPHKDFRACKRLHKLAGRDLCLYVYKHKIMRMQSKWKMWMSEREMETTFCPKANNTVCFVRCKLIPLLLHAKTQKDTQIHVQIPHAFPTETRNQHRALNGVFLHNRFGISIKKWVWDETSQASVYFPLNILQTIHLEMFRRCSLEIFPNSTCSVRHRLW